MSDTSGHREFYSKLFALLNEYGVEIIAGDDGKSFGLHSSQIEISFYEPFAEDVWTYIEGTSKLPERLTDGTDQADQG